MDLLKEIQGEIANYRSLQKAAEHVKDIKHDIDRMYAELVALEKQLEIEYKQYERLEGNSLKGFFYGVLGSKEKQLEKERQEYLQVSLKYDELKESIKLKEFERDVLEKKVGQFKQSEERLNRLKKQREQFLIRSNTKDSYRLREIINKMDRSTRLQIDISEALAAGQTLMHNLDQMIHLLKTARNWGRWDMQGGNSGRVYKRRKYSNIDRAKQVAYAIQNVMKSFEREVADVYSDFNGLNAKFDLDRFNGFTDVFFDNLISDWIVQQKIVNSLNNVKSIHDRVIRVLKALEVDDRKNQADLKDLEKNKEKILVGE